MQLQRVGGQPEPLSGLLQQRRLVPDSTAPPPTLTTAGRRRWPARRPVLPVCESRPRRCARKCRKSGPGLELHQFVGVEVFQPRRRASGADARFAAAADPEKRCSCRSPLRVRSCSLHHHAAHAYSPGFPGQKGRLQLHLALARIDAQRPASVSVKLPVSSGDSCTWPCSASSGWRSSKNCRTAREPTGCGTCGRRSRCESCGGAWATIAQRPGRRGARAALPRAGPAQEEIGRFHGDNFAPARPRSGREVGRRIAGEVESFVSLAQCGEAGCSHTPATGRRRRARDAEVRAG